MSAAARTAHAAATNVAMSQLPSMSHEAMSPAEVRPQPPSSSPTAATTTSLSSTPTSIPRALHSPSSSVSSSRGPFNADTAAVSVAFVAMRRALWPPNGTIAPDEVARVAGCRALGVRLDDSHSAGGSWGFAAGFQTMAAWIVRPGGMPTQGVLGANNLMGNGHLYTCVPSSTTGGCFEAWAPCDTADLAAARPQDVVLHGAPPLVDVLRNVDGIVARAGSPAVAMDAERPQRWGWAVAQAFMWTPTPAVRVELACARRRLGVPPPRRSARAAAAPLLAARLGVDVAAAESVLAAAESATCASDTGSVLPRPADGGALDNDAQPCATVALHVRVGDRRTHDASLHQLDEYVGAVRGLSRRMRVCTVLLTTDDPAVRADGATVLTAVLPPGARVVNITPAVPPPGGADQGMASWLGSQSPPVRVAATLDVMALIDILADADVIVGLCMSQIARLAASLQYVRGAATHAPVAVDFDACKAFQHDVPVQEGWVSVASLNALTASSLPHQASPLPHETTLSTPPPRSVKPVRPSLLPDATSLPSAPTAMVTRVAAPGSSKACGFDFSSQLVFDAPLAASGAGGVNPDAAGATCGPADVFSAVRRGYRAALDTPFHVPADGACAAPGALRWFTPEDACATIKAAGFVALVGDSLVRHLTTALYTVLAGDYENATVVLTHATDAAYVRCTCNAAYDDGHAPTEPGESIPAFQRPKNKYCREHALAYVAGGEPVATDEFGVEHPEVPLKPFLSLPALRAALPGGFCPDWGDTWHVCYNCAAMVLPPRGVVYQSGGLGEVRLVGDDGSTPPGLLDRIFGATNNGFTAPSTWRRVCGLLHAPGPLKPVEYLNVNGLPQTVAFNDAIVARACTSARESHFDPFTVTRNATSHDGQHYGQEANIVLAQLLLNHVAAIVREEARAGSGERQ